MAPPRLNDPMAQLMVETAGGGDRETHRLMEAMQQSVASMETTVQSIVTEQSEFQRWRPKVETKVEDITNTLKTIQSKVERFARNNRRYAH
jgi:septal ring factor EnvC (AmiA/AmiB activator)